MVSRTIFLVAVTVAAFGGAGLDRLIVTSRAELACPIPEPQQDGPLLPRGPLLPSTGNPRY